MRVYEVARELKIPAEDLIQLLRELRIPVRNEGSRVDDAIVARLRARFERERRAGHETTAEVIEAVLEDAQGPTRRRRRRRRVEEPVAEEPVAEEPTTEEAPAEEPVIEAVDHWLLGKGLFSGRDRKSTRL